MRMMSRKKKKTSFRKCTTFLYGKDKLFLNFGGLEHPDFGIRVLFIFKNKIVTFIKNDWLKGKNNWRKLNTICHRLDSFCHFGLDQAKQNFLSAFKLF